MKKLILLIILTFTTLYCLAESVAEGKAKHPNSNLYYCKAKTWDGIPPMSAIERIAVDVANGVMWIKFYDQEDEIEAKVNGRVIEKGDWNIFPTSIGKIGFNIEDEMVSYQSLSGTLNEIFIMDIKKTADAIRL